MMILGPSVHSERIVVFLLIGHEGEYEVALIRLGGGFGVVIG